MKEIKRGDIYYANLCPVIGSEQGGKRPVIILQNNVGNKYSDTTIVAAVTGELDKPKLPTHVLLTANGLNKKSLALLEQVRTIDKTRLTKYVGTVSAKTIKNIDRAIKISFGLNSQVERSRI